jgi:hypothetical protein
MSREIRDLSFPTQTKWNKLHDRCRRDTRLLKLGISILLSCTKRSIPAQEGLGGKWSDPIVSGQGFEFYILRHGRVCSSEEVLEIIYEHTRDLELAVSGMEPIKCEQISDGNK